MLVRHAFASVPQIQKENIFFHEKIYVTTIQNNCKRRNSVTTKKIPQIVCIIIFLLYFTKI